MASLVYNGGSTRSRQSSDPVRVEREKRRTEKEARVLAVITDPQVLGLVTLLGGLYAAQRIPYSDDPTRNDLLRGVATTGVVLAALSRAGLGSWQALAASGLAGGTAGGLFDFLGAKDAAGFLLGSDKRLFGIPFPGITP
jgi:hypothetical protein